MTPSASGRLRIAIGGLSHETNQYVAAPTERDAFIVTRGREIFTRHAGRTYTAGMRAAAEDLGMDVVGALHAIAPPSGPISASAYATLKADLLDALAGAGPFDAVTLELHGAAAADGIDDVEGDLCGAVRELIGAAVPLVVTHDLHGNITQAQADLVDGMFGVHSYPHEDMYERGREAIEAVPRLLSGEWRPVIHVERMPLLLPPLSTYAGAGARALDICQRLERRDGVLDCTFMHGFPYADNPNVGSTVVVTTDNDPEVARDVAREAATAIWALRDGFTVTHPQPAAAVAQALAMPGAPVVINETSDNPGGGSPCDGTHLLRELLRAKVADVVFVGIRDPQVVRQAAEAGVGATIEVQLGGKTDDLHGAPISCTAYVKALTDGETVIEATMARGWAYPLGPTARLVVDGVDVIVISNPMQTIDRTPLILHGIDPTTRKIIALKSSHHFRSGFQDLAAAIITTDPPGLTTLQIDQLPRSRTPRPVFPLEETTYP